MLHSIRLRLILSYTALALLTIVLIGVIAITLVTRYMAEREKQTLTMNARTVARMAGRHMAQPLQDAHLQQLTITSSFLTNTEVQILDRSHQVLADSQSQQAGLETAPALMLRIELNPRGREALPGRNDGLKIILSGTDSPRSIFALDIENDQLEGVSTAFSIERRPGMLGDLLVHEEPDGTDGTNYANSPDISRTYPFYHRLWHVLFGRVQLSVPPTSTGPTVTLPVHLYDNVVGFVRMTNRYPLSAEPLIAIRRSLLVAGVGAILVAVLLGFLISRSLTAPLMELESVTQRMEGGDLTVRAAETTGEIGDLSRHFNRMAVRLQATFADLETERDALRRFIADASHELRTPLTALSQFVEILQGQAGSDPGIRSEFLTESQLQLERLQWLTGNLLDLSRLDGGVASLDFANHEPAELLEGAVAPFRSLAEEKSVDLRLVVDANLERVCCDRASMEIALANLLDNALKHAPVEGFVELAATTCGKMNVLSIQDNGPGICPKDRDRIFDRFYRGKDFEGLPGTGLGLAIVKSAVEAHGGNVRVEEGPGAKFTIEIPSDPSASQGGGQRAALLC